MRVDLPRPLAPGRFVDLDIGWRFTVPDYGAGRMGRDGTLYEIGQWYPRMAVYDDVRGWNHEPYIGGGEFYLEYGGFDVALTVPATYIVGATGVLRNPERGADGRPAGPAGARRGARRRRSPSSRADEAGDAGADPAGRVRARSPGASPPTACATSPSAPRRTSAGTRARIDARWSTRSTARRRRSGRRPTGWCARRSSTTASSGIRYPYPHITSIEGPIEGMEYPMITFDARARPSREERQWVLAHELGHQWVPMIVGSNERLYPWMDEGFNTFIDLGNAARYFAGTPYGDSIEVHPLHLYPDHAIPGKEQPLISRPVESHDLFWTGYQKPALMMQTLRYEVLGQGAVRPRVPASTSGPGRTSTRRRPISSGSCATRRGWISTGSGATGSTPRPGWIRRWTRWARSTAQQKVFLSNRGTHDPAAGDGPDLRRRHHRAGAAAGRDVEPGAALRLPGPRRQEGAPAWWWIPRAVLPDVDRGNNRLR